MSRKNLEIVKADFKRLSAEIRKYGQEGEDDLRDLFDLHHPEVIFKMEPGPERGAQLAALIGDMKEQSRDLAYAKYSRAREAGEDSQKIIDKEQGMKKKAAK